MKKTLFHVAAMTAIVALTASCGGGEKPAEQSSGSTGTEAKSDAPPAYDAKRGEGKFTAESVGVTEKLDAAKATEGESVANVKCFSCHKVSDEKLVGPGWKGVTKRRKAEWIMNFITNPDPMLDKDPEAQAMLELCLVRMPNQNLSDDQARQVLEFMRKNDGVN